MPSKVYQLIPQKIEYVVGGGQGKYLELTDIQIAKY